MSDLQKPRIPEHRKVLHVDYYPSSITGETVSYCVLMWDTKLRRLVETWYEEVVPPWTPSLAQLATHEELQCAAIHGWECRGKLSRSEYDAEVDLWKCYLAERYEVKG